MPTDVVLPRMSSDCPDWASTPTVSDPYAVCSISGTAPSTDHGNEEVNGMTWLTGTRTYSAWPPSYVRPMSPMSAATLLTWGELPARARDDEPGGLDAEHTRVGDGVARVAEPGEQL